MVAIKFGVRTPVRLLHVSLDDGATVAEVKREVGRQLGQDAKSWTLSLTPQGDAPLSDGTKLSAVSIANKVIHCIVPKGVELPLPESVLASMAATASSAPAPAPAAGGTATGGAGSGAGTPAPPPARKLTERCRHGPHGACQYCAVVSDEEIMAKKDAPLNRTTVTRHTERSSKAGDLSGDMEWLCRHRADQMCINCAPLHKGEEVKLEMLCMHGPEARCTNCLPPDTTVEGRKYLTYGEWLERSRDKCQHAFTATCVNCAPPTDMRYKLKPGCSRHRPWPAAICLECAPATVDLVQQKYRHVDEILVHATAQLQSLIELVSVNEAVGLQRGAIMYGRYAPDPNYRHGVRAVVDALYEPPQRVDPATGAIQFLPDPHVKVTDAVAAVFGLVPVGWLITRKPTLKDKNVALLPHELYAIAAQQLTRSPRATDGKPGSQWVTLTVSKGEDKMYHLQGYQATDQLMAMVRDGVLAVPKAGDVKFRRREVKRDVPGELPVPDILAKDTVRGAYRTDSFDPDIGFVTMEASGASSAPSVVPATGAGGAKADAPTTAAPVDTSKLPIFRHQSFAPVNREIFGVKPTAAVDLKAHLVSYRAEPLHQRLSDFNALLFMAREIDPATALSAAASVAAGKAMDEGVQVLLEAIQSA